MYKKTLWGNGPHFRLKYAIFQAISADNGHYPLDENLLKFIKV